MTEFEAKLEEYKETFDDQFPLMCCRGMTDDEVVKTIERCLKKGKPFDPYAGDTPEDAVF